MEDACFCLRWHLGYCQKACLPWERGFDTFSGFLTSMTTPYTHEVAGKYPANVRRWPNVGLLWPNVYNFVKYSGDLSCPTNYGWAGYCQKACLPWEWGFDTFSGFLTSMTTPYTHEVAGKYPANVRRWPNVGLLWPNVYNFVKYSGDLSCPTNYGWATNLRYLSKHDKLFSNLLNNRLTIDYILLIKNIDWQ